MRSGIRDWSRTRWCVLLVLLLLSLLGGSLLEAGREWRRWTGGVRIAGRPPVVDAGKLCPGRPSLVDRVAVTVGSWSTPRRWGSPTPRRAALYDDGSFRRQPRVVDES